MNAGGKQGELMSSQGGVKWGAESSDTDARWSEVRWCGVVWSGVEWSRVQWSGVG